MVEQPEFFIDRSLGRFTVPEALRACGLVVHAMAEVYGERVGQGLQDERWLRDAGERGWVVLMKDDAIRRRPAEREALIDSGARAFCLTNAQLRGEEQARRFVENRHRILRQAVACAPAALAVLPNCRRSEGEERELDGRRHRHPSTTQREHHRMTFRSSLTRTATIALAIAALAAPTASARPADMPPAVAKAAAAQHKQYVRSVDTIDYPTRPVLDQPSAPANSRPDNTPQAPADPGTNWATIAIGIAGGLLAVGAIAGIASRTRRTGRARITA